MNLSTRRTSLTSIVPMTRRYLPVLHVTEERLEMLGTSFIPQHSDARILDQIIYKWKHSRHTITACLTESYQALIRDGWRISADHIERDVKRLFQDNFRNFVSLPV